MDVKKEGIDSSSIERWYSMPVTGDVWSNCVVFNK